MARLFRHAVWSAAEQFAQPLVTLIATPILSRSLGPEGFGLYALVLTLTAMSPLLSLGANSLVVRDVARYVRARRSIGAQVAIRHALALILAATAFILIATLILGEIFVTANRTTVFQAILFGIFCAATQEIDTVFAGALKGMSRFEWSVGSEFLGRIFWLTVVLWAAENYGIQGALFGGLVGLVGKALVKATSCAMLLSTPAVLFPSFGLRAARRLLTKSMWMWVQGLGSVLLISADRLIAGNFFGVAVMGRYVACTQLAQFALTVPAAAGQALLPWFNEQRLRPATKERAWRRKLVRFSAFFALPGILIALFSYPLLSMWLGQTTASESWSVLAALAISSAAIASIIPFHFGLLSLGLTRPLAAANLSGGCASVIACLVAAPFGLQAFSIAKLFYALPLALLPSIFYRVMAAHRDDSGSTGNKTR